MSSFASIYVVKLSTCATAHDFSLLFHRIIVLKGEFSLDMYCIQMAHISPLILDCQNQASWQIFEITKKNRFTELKLKSSLAVIPKRVFCPHMTICYVIYQTRERVFLQDIQTLRRGVDGT